MFANPWKKYIAIKFENGKNRCVIIDEKGNVINENPTKEDMDGLFYYYFNIKPVLRLPNEKCKRYLLEFIRYWYRENGSVPEVLDFNKNPKYPSFNVYKKIFGNWNNAIREAGLIPNCGGTKENLYTDEELLEYQIKWYDEHDEPPTVEDYIRDPKYPSTKPYYDRLGGWQTSLKMLGLNIDSLARRGIIITNDQKGRIGEIFVLDSFEQIGAIDLSGEKCLSHCDGICPQGYNYDVKTSGVDIDRWRFTLRNANIDKIKWFYLIGFNKDYTKIMHAWRVPKTYLDNPIKKGGQIIVHISEFHHRGSTDHNISNMKQYEITDRIRPIFDKWLENIKKQDNSKDAIIREARERLRQYVEDKNKVKQT